ncbi:Cof-type HAD-IIB family hydrolase [Streptococcus cameli]
MTIKKIFATDLDGTFLRPDHSFDREGLEEILKLFKEKDYLLVAASGRPLLSLKSVFNGYEEQMGFLAENGSIVAYRDQIIFEDAPIAKKIYLPLIEAIKAGPYGSRSTVLLSGKNGAFLLDSIDKEYYDRIINYYPNTVLVTDFATVEAAIVKLVVTFDQETLEEANRWLNETFPEIHSVTTGFDSVDIILNGNNKAVGLNYLCEHFGLSSQDVVAFGDNENDIEMLEFAGLALVPSNAKLSIQLLADQVIGSCQDDAVLTYLKQYLKKETQESNK